MRIDDAPPPHLLKVQPVYCRLMEEIKRRDAAIRETTSGKFPLPLPVASDLCYVQLRKICELIGLSCLVAHGDLPGVREKALQKEYRPDVIIKRMEKLHSGFYPQPSEKFAVPGKSGHYESRPLKDGFLSKSALMSLYAECGDKLHRGNVRQLLSGQDTGVDVDLQKIERWRHRIVALLNHHHIFTSNPNFHLIVQMQTDSGGRVQCAIFRRVLNSESSSGP